MLNETKLCKDIQTAIEETLPSAIAEGLKNTFPDKTDMGDEMAANMGDTITSLIAKPLGDRIGSAIHAYIKNISIYGTVITVGSPATQSAQIIPATPITGGKVPNCLGIQ